LFPCVHFPSPVPRLLARLVAWLWLAAAAGGIVAAAETAPVRFDLPAGAAAESLKRFGQQARREILFPAEAVAGVRTHELRGDYTPRAALDRLLAGTALSVVEDAQTGALMILRAPAVRPVSGEAPRREPPPPKPANPPDKPMNRKTPLAALGALLGFGPLAAQTAPAPAPADAAKDQPIVLGEFRVDTTKDRGYVATNSTTGTRLNISIKELPMPVEIITREFIDDIGAVDVKEALEYSAGIVQDTVTTSNNFMFSPSGSGQAGSLTRDGASVAIRGLNTRSFLRSGFRQDSITDVVNVDRQEVARGPQSLLYGVGALGGIVAITPKYPRATRKTDLRFGYGSNDFQRAELYHTGPLWKARNDTRYVNYGAGLVYQHLSTRSDFDDRSRFLFTPAVELRPFKDTVVFLDFEYGRFKIEGNGYSDLGDSNAGNIRQPGTGLLLAENLNEFNETRTVARDLFRRDRFYRWSGGDTYSEEDYFTGTVEITQKLFPGLTASFGANYTDRLITNRTIGGSIQRVTTAGPAVAPTALGVWTSFGADPVNPALTQWKTVSYSWGRAVSHRYINQVRADLAYEFRVRGNRQTLLGGFSDQTARTRGLSTSQVTSNIAGGTGSSFVGLADVDYLRYRGEQHRPNRDTVGAEWDTGFYAVYQGKWFRDRLTAIAGARAQRYMVREFFYTYAKANAALPDSDLANWVKPAAPDAASLTSAPGQLAIRNGYRWGGDPQRNTTYTGGLNFEVTRDINLYAVSAGGVFPNRGQRDGAANAFEPELTQSRELGAKLDLWRDRNGRSRVSATVSWFKVDRENAVYNVFWAPQPRSNDQTTLRAGMTQNVRVSGTGPGAYAVTSSAYTTFQRNQPVTYLLPATYVAAADAAHPRVTGAPQQGGFILVDYASLGSAAADPLRRAMEAAAADPANLTALQGNAVGSGATGLYANNAYTNRNSDVPYDDRSHGVEAQVYLNFTDNWSTVLTYTHLVQGITGGFQVVDQPNSTEYDSWWRYMGRDTEAARANLDESAVDILGGVKGRRTSDTPRNVWAMWNKYTFPAGRLHGLDASVGVTVNGPRQGEVVIDNGIRDRSNDENRRYRPQIPAEYKFNLAFGYRVTLSDRRWNFRLNVNNVLDEQKIVGTNTTTMFINPATGAAVASTAAGAQRITVANRSVRYFEPRSFRLTASTSF
jgi:iron complex outermembrane receptor protein